MVKFHCVFGAAVTTLIFAQCSAGEVAERAECESSAASIAASTTAASEHSASTTWELCDEDGSRGRGVPKSGQAMLQSAKTARASRKTVAASDDVVQDASDANAPFSWWAAPFTSKSTPPTSSKWVKYPGMHCYDGGHGGIGGDNDMTAPVTQDLHECFEQCDKAQCGCVVFGLHSGKCWRRSFCQPVHCTEVEWATTYMKISTLTPSCWGSFKGETCGGSGSQALKIHEMTDGGLAQNSDECLARCAILTMTHGWGSKACCRWYEEARDHPTGNGCLLYPGTDTKQGLSLFKAAVMHCEEEPHRDDTKTNSHDDSGASETDVASSEDELVSGPDAAPAPARTPPAPPMSSGPDVSSAAATANSGPDVVPNVGSDASPPVEPPSPGDAGSRPNVASNVGSGPDVMAKAPANGGVDTAARAPANNSDADLAAAATNSGPDVAPRLSNDVESADAFPPKSSGPDVKKTVAAAQNISEAEDKASGQQTSTLGATTESDTKHNAEGDSGTASPDQIRPQSGCSGEYTYNNCASPEISALAISNHTDGGLPDTETDCLDRCGVLTKEIGYMSNACCRWFEGGKHLTNGKGCLLYPGAAKEEGASMFVKAASMACH